MGSRDLPVILSVEDLGSPNETARDAQFSFVFQPMNPMLQVF